jgi:ribosomal protein S18 acetylase RimI-like enzyme
MSTEERFYGGEADYARMRSMLVESFALSGPPDYVTIGDLDWWRFTDDDPDALRAARLWIVEDAVVGFAWPVGGAVDLLAHPRHRRLEGEMLAWAESQVASQLPSVAAVNVFAYKSDRLRIDALRRHGYELASGGLTLHYYLMDVAAAIAPPSLPHGYRLRHVQGEADLERRVAVHRDAFAPSEMSIEKHRRVMSAPTYRPELDLVIVAPDDSFAAFCIVWFDEHNRIGVFEPVGCAAAHRQRGLTKTLLLEGLSRLAGIGATSAAVVCDARSEAANRLYESVGFTLLDRNVPWTKVLRRDVGRVEVR